MRIAMQYMIAFRESPEELARRGQADGPQYWGAWMAYIGALQQSGIIVSGSGLEPPHTGTIVRVVDGKRQVQDGPYPDSKEQLGGFFIVDVPDLDTALEWVARAPCASAGSVEVRPLMPPMP